MLESRPSRVLEKREGPAETQDGVRTSFSGRHIARKGGAQGGRGTGAVKATGSYEGSLSVEGTSGRHEPLSFTRRWSRRPWRLPHAGRRRLGRANRFKRSGEGPPMNTLRKRKRRQRCQRLGRSAGAVGRKRPRSESSRIRPKGGTSSEQSGAIWQRVSSIDPPKRSECRETFGPPVNRTEPKTPRGVHAAKAAE